jgi:hypothetical protein
VDYDVIPLSVGRAEECVAVAAQTITEVARRANGALP